MKNNDCLFSDIQNLCNARGGSPRVFAEFLREMSRRKKNGLRELMRNLAFENFCSWSEREKIFFLGLICICIPNIIVKMKFECVDLSLIVDYC